MSNLPEDTDYRVSLEIFEGPLDLLLHLIRTQEIDIYDIPIAKITDQYVQHLQLMQHLNITVAGEFLLMAATLIHIKSKMLLPPDPAAEAEEFEDPRRELVEQLLDHERFKQAAQLLWERETVELSVWPRGHNEFEQDEQELVTATLFDLVKAFHAIVERFKDQVALAVEHESVTLEQKVSEIRRLLQVEREFLFSTFIARGISRLHLIVTVLALLELARLHEVKLFQKGNFEDIRIVGC
jgi:segregation and condensation protein A